MEVRWSRLGIFVFWAAVSVTDASVKVQVAQGWLEGEILDTVIGDCRYYSFKGIPYAKAPIGNLRFKAPRPPLPWSGVRNAKQHGPVCPQMNIFSGVITPGSEDCLFLNVYTPNMKPKELLPVIFHIHGGAFKSGSGNIDNFGPDFLINQGVIVITINYRFDALGFLCLNTKEVPGNAGLKDQVAALKWVKENVMNFGGNPSKVTIMGQSAGGSSVALHLLSPMSAGLFQRAIVLSGAPNHNYGIPYQPQARPYILGKELGFDTQDPDELLKFLQNLPVRKLIGTYPVILTTENSTRNNIFKNFYYTPVVEKNFGNDNFLTQTPEQYAKAGVINKADLIIGHTDQETLLLADAFVESYLAPYDRYPEMLVPRKILITSPPDIILKTSKIIREHYFSNQLIDSKVLSEFITYANDVNFIYDIHTYVNSLPNPYNCGRYFYIFACVSERNYYGKRGEKYGIHGASHYDDLQYIFQANSLNMSISKYSREYYLIQRTTKMITDFVKYGNPTPYGSVGSSWPVYNNITKRYLYMGNKLAIKSYPDRAAVEFWSKIYNYAGL